MFPGCLAFELPKIMQTCKSSELHAFLFGTQNIIGSSASGGFDQMKFAHPTYSSFLCLCLIKPSA
jgi:hypothetical protein